MSNLGTDSKKLSAYKDGIELGRRSHQRFAVEVEAEVTTPEGTSGAITKDVSRKYGILKEDMGIALRGLFIINPEGIIQYQLVHDLSVGRSVDETLRVLKALQTGENCPVNWEPGESTL